MVKIDIKSIDFHLYCTNYNLYVNMERIDICIVPIIIQMKISTIFYITNKDMYLDSIQCHIFLFTSFSRKCLILVALGN